MSRSQLDREVPDREVKEQPTMDYLPLGNTGLYVSRLCFGAMTFAQPDQKYMAWLGNEGQESADHMVRTALDAGINFFDTANIYANGASERMLSKALGAKRDDVIIATKLYHPSKVNANAMGTSRVAIMREVEGSLERLGTDRIDLYQVHAWDATTPIEETLRALDDCVRQGKVRYIGLSNFAAWQIAHADGVARLHGTERFCSVQAYYSLVGRELEREILPATMHLGLGTMIWSPLAAGFLSGKYTNTQDNGATPGGRRSRFSFPPVDPVLGDPVVRVLREIGGAHGVSPSRVAIRWLLYQDGVTTVIIGARKHEQLLDNLAATDLELSDDELKQLNDISEQRPEYPQWMPSLERAGDPVAALKHSAEVAIS